jgi:hypothetical protein
MQVPMICLLVLVVAGGAPPQVAAPTPTPYVVPVAAPDVVIVFEKPFYRGEWMRLRVGDELPDLRDTPGGNWELRISSLKVGYEAVAVLYSAVNFRRFCLGLAGRELRGSGYYPDLASVENKSLRNSLGDNTRSLRVLGKEADLNTVCEPVTPRAKSKLPRR